MFTRNRSQWNSDPQRQKATSGFVTLRTAGRSTVIFGIIVFTLALAMRVAHLNAPPAYDELYHILAAQSWLSDGTFAVYQGEYPRVPLYTIMTAWMFDLAGGPDLAMARAPNVIFGAMLAAGSAIWIRNVVGNVAGWIFIAFVLFWPSGLQLSQVIRFYAVHGLLFFIGAIATYALFRPKIALQRRLVMAVLAIGALWFAKQFQDSTLVGILGLTIWVAAFVILPAVIKLKQGRVILVAGIAILLIGASAAFMNGTLEGIWAKYNVSPWGRDATAYHRVLTETYPLFWPVTPVLAIMALRAFPRPAGFCVTLVGTGLIVHSFAGVQNLRYIYYISPFLFAIWVMGLQALLPVLLPHLRIVTDTIKAPLKQLAKVPAISAILFAGLFALAANDAVIRGAKIALGKTVAPLVNVESWAPARAVVSQHVNNGELVVATNELAAIYYFGGFDVVFSKNWMTQMEPGEFAYDHRTGRPLIQTIPSLADLVQAYEGGIFLASRSWWLQWPGNNNVIALLMSFQAPNVSWNVEQVGPVTILHWQNDNLSEDAKYDRIRQIVGTTIGSP